MSDAFLYKLLLEPGREREKEMNFDKRNIEGYGLLVLAYGEPFLQQGDQLSRIC